MFRTWTILVAMTALFLTALGAPPIAEARERELPRLQDFGFGTMKVGGQKALGVRPLLVIMAEFRDKRFSAAHDENYYRQLYFGRRGMSVARYFNEVSHGLFGFREAGVVRMTLANRGITGVDESLFPAGELPDHFVHVAIQQLAGGRGFILRHKSKHEFAFREYDTNRDGRITPNELTIVMVVPEKDGGQRRSLEIRTRQGRVTGGMVVMGERRSLNTACHELLHTLGTLDIYGPGAKYNANLTIMGGKRGDDSAIYHLDPWHKMRLGWIAPRIITSGRGGVEVLTAPQAGGPRVTQTKRPLLLYSPRKGTREFFMIEFRNPGLGGFDVNAAHRGVVVWMVKTGANGQLLDYVPEPGKHGYTLQYLSTTSTPGLGSLAAHTSPFALKWWAQADTGIRMRYRQAAATTPSTIVDWGVAGRTYVPAVSTRSVTIRPGQRFHLDGKFGVRDRQSVVLINRGGTHEARIATWSNTRLTLDAPRSLAPGSYRLVVYRDASRQGDNFGIPASVPLPSIRQPVPVRPSPALRPPVRIPSR